MTGVYFGIECNIYVASLTITPYPTDAAPTPTPPPPRSHGWGGALFAFSVLDWNYNRRQTSLGHLCNLTNYLCFTAKVCKKRCFPFKNALLCPLPTQYNVGNQKKLQVVVFDITWGKGGEVREMKLYLRLVCAQKRQKCKFVPGILSMIVA